MAKGDSGRSQNQIDYQGGLAQNNLNNTRNQLNNQYGPYFNNYQNTATQQMGDYSNMMQGYNTFLSGGNPGQNNAGRGQQNMQRSTMPGLPSYQGPNIDSGLTGQQQPYNFTGNPTEQDLNQYFTSRGVNPSETSYWMQKWPELMARGQELGNPNYAQERLSQAESLGGGQQQGPNGSAISGWQNFAQTGGFSPQDIQDIRARAIAPTRGIYQNAQDELSRQKNLGGSYMPNYAAGAAKLARESNSAIADQNVNANAAIAQMVQQGKLAGLGGLTNAQLGAMAGQTGLYGATPGMMSTTGNQLLGAGNQLLGTQQLQNQLGLGIMNAQNQKASIPGNYEQALGNIGSTMGLLGSAGSILSGLGGRSGSIPGLGGIGGGGVGQPNYSGVTPGQQDYWNSGNQGPVNPGLAGNYGGVTPGQQNYWDEGYIGPYNSSSWGQFDPYVDSGNLSTWGNGNDYGGYDNPWNRFYTDPQQSFWDAGNVGPVNY